MIKTIIIVLAMAASTACLPYNYQTYSSQTEKELEVGMRIKPDLGWKWNTKYPAKFKVRFANNTFTESAKFTDGKIHMTFLAEKEIKDMTIVATFSICSPSTCRVFRDQEFDIELGTDR